MRKFNGAKKSRARKGPEISTPRNEQFRKFHGIENLKLQIRFKATATPTRGMKWHIQMNAPRVTK